uniref:Uncharacterized protein n=1 Tax=Medicago truncatula TaxID=3880 RepID=A2Q4A6_MEDTR|nr:hypothetical protein MtrDRAFT_AC157375g24v1 [Medicago truncatula]
MKTINRTGSKKLGESLLLRHRHRRHKIVDVDLWE